MFNSQWNALEHHKAKFSCIYTFINFGLTNDQIIKILVFQNWTINE